MTSMFAIASIKEDYLGSVWSATAILSANNLQHSMSSAICGNRLLLWCRLRPIGYRQVARIKAGQGKGSDGETMSPKNLVVGIHMPTTFK